MNSPQKHKIALVTGASRGIGKSIAIALAAANYKVYVNYNHGVDKATAVAEEIRNNGGVAVPLGCNVSQSDEVTQMIHTIKEESGKIDVLVNNAGITQDMAIFRMSEKQWRQVLETNLFGAFFCIKAVAFFMMKQQSGCIINISSLSSYYGAPGQANYAASKAGIIGLTRCLASELGPMNITVNSVIPGLIPTDMTQKIPADKMETLCSRIPLKRTGTCTEIADLVGFLVSEKARYITGQVIAADGGLSCQLGA